MKNLTLTLRISILVVLLLIALLFVSLNMVTGLRGVIATIESDNQFRQYNTRLLGSWEQYEQAYAVAADTGNRFTARAVPLEDMQLTSGVVRVELADLIEAVNALSPELFNQWQMELAGTQEVGIEQQLELFITDQTFLNNSFEALNTGWEEMAGFAARKKTQKDMELALANMDVRVKAFDQLYQQFTEMRSRDVIAAQKAKMSQAIIIAVIVLIAATLFSLFLLRSMRKNLKQIVNQTLFLAQGDLTRTIPRNTNKNEIDDVNRSVATLQEKLHTVFQSVLELSGKLKHSTKALSQDSKTRLEGAQLQRNKTEEITNAFEQIENASERVGDNAAQAIEKSDDAMALAQQGVDIVSATVDIIQTLATKIEAAVTVISKLDAQAEDIQNILSVITGIAGQTNLLALNAAIEAARAGEQGRGFAVVADEVRTLAVRTQQSTDEIQATLESLTSGTGLALETITESQKVSTDSVEKIAEAGAVISKISQAVEQIRQVSEGTSASSREQIDTLKSVSAILSEVANIASDNAAQAESSTTLSEDLTDVSRSILSSVKEFTLKP